MARINWAQWVKTIIKKKKGGCRRGAMEKVTHVLRKLGPKEYLFFLS